MHLKLGSAVDDVFTIMSENYWDFDTGHQCCAHARTDTSEEINVRKNRMNTYSRRDYRSYAGQCQDVSDMRDDATSASREVMRDASNPTAGESATRQGDSSIPQKTTRICAQFPLVNPEKNTLKVFVDRDHWQSAIETLERDAINHTIELSKERKLDT